MSDLQERCRAAGCTQNHSSHTCNLCGDTNSDHRAMDCKNGTDFVYHGTSIDCLRYCSDVIRSSDLSTNS